MRPVRYYTSPSQCCLSFQAVNLLINPWYAHHKKLGKCCFYVMRVIIHCHSQAFPNIRDQSYKFKMCGCKTTIVEIGTSKTQTIKYSTPSLCGKDLTFVRYKLSNVCYCLLDSSNCCHRDKNWTYIYIPLCPVWWRWWHTIATSKLLSLIQFIQLNSYTYLKSLQEILWGQQLC